jgi:alkanesulfonate monooxygenase SsuD/methylene tetrahydromethanopterin reductase-like flavin-dependent oxidoreductase (luciferase family)
MKSAIWDNIMPRAGSSHVALYREHLKEVQIAEECGFDHLWFYEHHLSPQSPMPSPNLMIAAAAQLTTRIRLGNMVNVLPYRNPLLLAEECAMLDVLTGGRLDIGIGRGLKPTEFAAFCVPQERSRAMFNESVEIMSRVWADENFRYEGEFFRVNKASPLSPPLVQRPHPPLYISAQSEESLRWCAERDLPFGQIDALIDQCRRDSEFYAQIQAAAGHARAPRLFLTREVYVAETDEQARREALPYLKSYWELWGRYTQFTQQGLMPDSYDVWRKRAPLLHAMSYEELIERGLVLIGCPETVARGIHEHQDMLDIAILVCVMQLGPMPHEQVQRSMRAFAQHVMPLVKSGARRDLKTPAKEKFDA